MIQFNLLPDVKLEYMRAQRTKRMVTVISVLATVVSLAILIVLLLVVFVFQRQYMNDLSADITKHSKDLKETKDINKILTVQNQLNSLAGLHEDKPDTTRVFTFIQKVTPQDITIDTLSVDFENGMINISGAAPTLVFVNQFVDTLKFTDYQKGDGTKARAFSEVVLASFGRATEGASYMVSMKFDPVIFSNTETVELEVPTQKITTRSETERPKVLFEALSDDESGEGQ